MIDIYLLKKKKMNVLIESGAVLSVVCSLLVGEQPENISAPRENMQEGNDGRGPRRLSLLRAVLSSCRKSKVQECWLPI